MFGEFFRDVVLTGVGVDYVTSAHDWRRWLGVPMILLGLVLVAQDVKRWRAQR